MPFSLRKSVVCLLHSLPGFSASRRQKLEHNLEILGATILDDIWKAKYIVISESIRSLAIVAKRMRVEEERLIQHLEKNVDIRCALPSWADYCISSVKCLAIPSRIHTWCHSQTFATTSKIVTRNISVKRNRDEIDDNNEKQTIGEEPLSRKKVISKNDGSIQTRRECYFRRNVQVAEAFKNLASLHQSMSLIPADTWKSYSFQIVAGRLLELNFEVANDEETQRKLRSIKGFGKSVCEKIQECIEHGTISRIQEFKSDPQRQAMRNLKDIWGVGIVRASDLMDRGYRTIDDVRLGIRQNKLLLDRNQLVGVDCYEDILDRMSRSEAEEIGETVRVVAESLFPGIETSIMGSYRRGKDFCGDVDIQLTHPAFVRNIPTDALGRIIGKFTEIYLSIRTSSSGC
jgi:ribosomal protein S13